MIINIAANDYLKVGTKGREFISSLIFMNIDILLVGCGGTGGCFFSKMVRFLTSIEFHGIDFRFRMIDGDRVEAKNIGRQPFLLEDVGKNKAVALASVAEELMDIKVRAYPFYLSPGTIEVLDQFDFDSGNIQSIVNDEDYILLKKLYVEGYSYQEICTENNLTKAALGCRIHRIKKKILAQLMEP